MGESRKARDSGQVACVEIGSRKPLRTLQVREAGVILLSSICTYLENGGADSLQVNLNCLTYLAPPISKSQIFIFDSCTFAVLQP